MTAEEIKAVLDAHLKWVRGEGGGARANLAGAYLAGANLAGANLDGANLAGAYLARANLAGANLAGANLVGENLVGASLVGANLVGENLVGASLVGANLGNDRRAVGLIARVTRIEEPYEFFAWRTDKGDFIKAGCRFMSVDEYRKHIDKEYPGTTKASETLAILDFIRSRFETVKP